MNRHKINIQVLLYNSSPNMEKLLKSITTLHVDNLTNIFFTDQSENDREYKIVKKYINETNKELKKNIKLFLSKQPNYGFGKGHNEIYRKNRLNYKDFFIILNPDSLFSYDTISKIVDYINRLNSINWGLLEIEQFPNEHPKYYDPKTLETPWASAASLIIKNEAFETVGMFDENIFMYGEDVDLSIQMRIHEYKVLHLPDAKFTHLTKDTDISKNSDFTRVYKQAAQLYLRYKYAKDSDVEKYKKLIDKKDFQRKKILQEFERMIKNLNRRTYYKKFLNGKTDDNNFRWSF